MMCSTSHTVNINNAASPAASSCFASPLASPGKKNVKRGPCPTAPTTACNACSAACRRALLPLPAAATSCSAAARQLLISIPASGATKGCCSTAACCCCCLVACWLPPRSAEMMWNVLMRICKSKATGVHYLVSRVKNSISLHKRGTHA
jgi:hypothetical protein